MSDGFFGGPGRAEDFLAYVLKAQERHDEWHCPICKGVHRAVCPMCKAMRRGVDLQRAQEEIDARAIEFLKTHWVDARTPDQVRPPESLREMVVLVARAIQYGENLREKKDREAASVVPVDPLAGRFGTLDCGLTDDDSPEVVIAYLAGRKFRLMANANAAGGLVYRGNWQALGPEIQNLIRRRREELIPHVPLGDDWMPTIPETDLPVEKPDYSGPERRIEL